MTMEIRKNASGNYDFTVDGVVVLYNKSLGECIIAYTDKEEEERKAKSNDNERSD